MFAHGGAKQHLRTQLGLYRQSGSGFTKNLDSGAFVQLGEELMLRAQVKAGDGKEILFIQFSIDFLKIKPILSNRLESQSSLRCYTTTAWFKWRSSEFGHFNQIKRMHQSTNAIGVFSGTGI